jgi:hypothetical protein
MPPLGLNISQRDQPEFNAIDECGEQGKHDLRVSKYYP